MMDRSTLRVGCLAAGAGLLFNLLPAPALAGMRTVPKGQERPGLPGLAVGREDVVVEAAPRPQVAMEVTKPKPTPRKRASKKTAKKGTRTRKKAA